MKHYLPTILTLAFLFSFLLKTSGQAESILKARIYIDQQTTRLGLQSTDIQDIIVTDNYTSKHNLVTHVYFKQRYNGIIIERAVLNVNLDDNLDLINLHSRFHSNLSELISSTSPSIDAVTALNKALSNNGLSSNEELHILEQKNDVSQYTLFDRGNFSQSSIPVFLVYEPLENGNLALAWSVDIYTKDANHFWNIKVDAHSGEILSNKDLVIHCNFTKDNHNHSSNYHPLIGKAEEKFAFEEQASLNSENGFFDYQVYPLPVESPNHGEREIVSNPAHPVASPFGWHDTDGILGAEYSITRGNNVWAKDDDAGDNEDSIGYSPDPGFFLEYIYPLDLEMEPATYLDASITNLFYWNNIIHDVWYQYGFDEESGNFQANNYGRGGLGEDWVQADCQDGGFDNNANFFTPAEPDTMNRKPRMQMALWTGPGIGSRFITVNSPASIQGIYDATRANFGPDLPPVTMPITGELVLADDGSGTPASGCSPLINGAEVAGKIAFIDAMGCAFTVKVQNAQDAGAIAVVFCFPFPGNPVTIGGESTTITIPSVMVNQQLCLSLKNELPNVNVSISRDPDGGPSQLDSDLDNGVIVHEYGHGISNRLVGGPANRDCLGNQEQAGEGWSDWFALMMTIEPGDLGSDSRGIGTYLSVEPLRGPGIRPYPYSNNHFINPHTYRSIGQEFYPHGSGSVMAATLWDLSWALIEEHGYDPDIYHGTGGNNQAFQLVIDGLKLIPCEPGYVDIRDGILMADSINYSGANQCLIWNVFAQRGLGFGANQGSTGVRGDGTESFILPPSCIQELAITKTVSATSAEPGDTLTFVINVFNGSDQILTNNIVRDTFPPGIDYVVGSVNCGANFSEGILTIPLGTLEPQDEIECSFQVIVNGSFATNYFFFDQMEAGDGNWVVSHGVGDIDWELLQVAALSGTHAWFADNLDNKTDQYLTLANPVMLTGDDLRLRFAHNFRTEALYDGGVVEISADGGPWEDLGPHMVQNGYAGELNADNPMGERNAFWGSSNGYQTTIVDLQAYEGQSVLIRFRFATDEILGNVGWRIDDVSIANEKTIPNTACITNDQNFDSCASVDDPTIIIDPVVVSVAEIESTFDIFVYPNPGNGLFNIGLTGSANGPVFVSVFHINGQKVMDAEVDEIDLSAHYSVDLQNYPSGMYVFKVESQKTTIIKKIILQH